MKEPPLYEVKDGQLKKSATYEPESDKKPPAKVELRCRVTRQKKEINKHFAQKKRALHQMPPEQNPCQI
ncbi:MAG: hypothetical protein K9K39_04950, partial [Desulfohalobiaceae bacterium]|nr:hypothetical protein [Desulfohalobiaceae bacterium]